MEVSPILVVILLGIKLEYAYYPMDKYENCFDSGMLIIETIAQHHIQTKDKSQGYYTKDGKLVVGHYCQ